MARIQWQGQTINAKPLEELANGDWLMEAQAHGPRFAPGTKIRVTKNEIIEMAAAETPPAQDELAKSAAAVEQAMAEERKTLPTVAELLAKAAADRQPQDTTNGPQAETQA